MYSVPHLIEPRLTYRYFNFPYINWNNLCLPATVNSQCVFVETIVGTGATQVVHENTQFRQNQLLSDLKFPTPIGKLDHVTCDLQSGIPRPLTTQTHTFDINSYLGNIECLMSYLILKWKLSGLSYAKNR